MKFNCKMPSITSALLVICLIAALCTETTLSIPILDDLFRGFIRDSQLANEPSLSPSNKERVVVKRRIYADNPDAAGLKQISLQSLIGNVEDSLFQTALSVGGVVHDGNDAMVVPEIKPPNSAAIDDRTVNKRETEVGIGGGAGSAATESSAEKETKNILLQTTERVPAGNGLPAHILIDRIAVRQHQGGLPIIPAFQVYRTKVVSAAFKEPSTSNPINSDKDGGLEVNSSTTKKSNGEVLLIAIPNEMSMGSTESTAAKLTAESLTKLTTTTIRTVGEESIESSKEQKVGSSEAGSSTTTTSTTTSAEGGPMPMEKAATDGKLESVATTTTTTPSSPTTTTTKLPINKLKEAEEDLKEKVAEIEAEPVILSARV